MKKKKGPLILTGVLVILLIVYFGLSSWNKKQDKKEEKETVKVTDILAHNDVSLQKKKVLDYLAENGYIARRSYTNIETIMINARAMRNQKEK